MNKDPIQTFDRKETARILGVSVVTVDRLLAQKLISHCRVGRRIVFQTEHITEFLDSNTHKARNKVRDVVLLERGKDTDTGLLDSGERGGRDGES